MKNISIHHHTGNTTFGLVRISNANSNNFRPIKGPVRRATGRSRPDTPLETGTPTARRLLAGPVSSSKRRVRHSRRKRVSPPSEGVWKCSEQVEKTRFLASLQRVSLCRQESEKSTSCDEDDGFDKSPSPPNSTNSPQGKRGFRFFILSRIMR